MYRFLNTNVLQFHRIFDGLFDDSNLKKRLR